MRLESMVSDPCPPQAVIEDSPTDSYFNRLHIALTPRSAVGPNR